MAAWLHEDPRSQGISSHGSVLILPEYSNFSTRMIKLTIGYISYIC